MSLAVQNNESHCIGMSLCICACPVKHQCPDQQTMGGNVLQVTDRSFGCFRPPTADSPHPSSQGAVNCVHNLALCWACIFISMPTMGSCTHCLVLWRRDQISQIFVLLSYIVPFKWALWQSKQCKALTLTQSCIKPWKYFIHGCWWEWFHLQHERVSVQLFPVVL